MDKEQLKHRILQRTVKTPSCWFYTGAKNGGYGAITIDGKKTVVHKLMYRAVIGEVPEGKELDHLCGIKHCVNPEHLQPVTHLENTRRGPQYKGLDVNHLMPSRKKTHLLYIHNDRFRKEKNKSALVNKLLEEHYWNEGIKEVNTALSNAKVPTEDRYVATPEGVYGPTKLEPKAQKFCKNGHPVPSGRDRCLGKGCKYA